jgi:glycosyltransferase involved in cell wall biosynthesis
MYSIVIPYYNGDKFIKRCLKSILKLDIQHSYEILICNDYSDLYSEIYLNSVVNELSLFYNFKNLYILKNKYSKGISGALNTSILASRYQWIVRMDSDDVCLFNRFKHMSKYINNYDVIFGSAVSFPNLLYMPVSQNYNSFRNELLIRNPIIHSASAFKKDIVIQIGLYNHKYNGIEDYELWSKLITIKGVKIYFDQNPYILYRIHNNQFTKLRNTNLMNDLRIDIKNNILNIQLNKNNKHNNSNIIRKNILINNRLYGIFCFFRNLCK